MNAVDGAATGVGGDGGEQGALGNAVADLLALHVASGRGEGAGLLGAVDQRMRLRLGPVDGGESGCEEYKHGRQDCPAVARRAGHAAKSVSESGGNNEDGENLEKV